jgi:transcriptional regulator with XRE-family HTH domain
MLSRTKFTEIVGANVKKIRQEKGLTQEDVCAKAGFYRSYLNLVEKAKRMPSSYSLYKLAKALEVEVDRLYPSTV